jgi:hypothetical protein
MLDASQDAEGLRALLASERIEVALTARLEFASGALLLSNRLLSYTVAGEVWQGLGDLVGVSQARGGPGDLSAVMTYQLALPREVLGPSPELGRLPALMAAPGEYAERRAVLALQLFRQDSAGNSVPFDTPKVLHSGRMSKPRISLEPGGVLTFEIDSESLLVRKRQPRAGRLTDADQQRRYPGDRGLEFIPNATSGQLDWLNS